VREQARGDRVPQALPRGFRVSRPSRPPFDEPAEVRVGLARWQIGGVVVFVALVAAFPLYRAVDSSQRTQSLNAQTRAQVVAGRQLWALNCASCHGDSGQGVGAPALNSQQFLTSVTDEQIHRIASAGISGTAMPAWSNEFGGPLTDEELAAIVAYIRSWEPTAPSRPDWRNPQPGPSP
jgi:mono/diheme cytochrome c family protein